MSIDFFFIILKIFASLLAIGLGCAFLCVLVMIPIVFVYMHRESRKNCDFVVTYDEFLEDFENRPFLYHYDNNNFMIYCRDGDPFGGQYNNFALTISTLWGYTKAWIKVVVHEAKVDKLKLDEEHQKKKRKYKDVLSKMQQGVWSDE